MHRGVSAALSGPDRHPLSLGEPTAHHQLPAEGAFQGGRKQRVIPTAGEVHGLPHCHERRIGLEKAGQGATSHPIAPCQLLGSLGPRGRIRGMEHSAQPDQSLRDQPDQLVIPSAPVRTPQIDD